MSHHRLHSSAPFGVKVLAVVVAADGLLALGRGVGLLQASLALALAFGVVGALQLALSWGLWSMEPYAFALGFVVFGGGLLLDLARGNVVDAVLSGTTLSMLYHYRGLFRR